jgi:hypothetical protein
MGGRSAGLTPTRTLPHQGGGERRLACNPYPLMGEDRRDGALRRNGQQVWTQ